jgi:parallel beta-helix repeat protein
MVRIFPVKRYFLMIALSLLLVSALSSASVIKTPFGLDVIVNKAAGTHQLELKDVESYQLKKQSKRGCENWTFVFYENDPPSIKIPGLPRWFPLRTGDGDDIIAKITQPNVCVEEGDLYSSPFTITTHPFDPRTVAGKGDFLEGDNVEYCVEVRGKIFWETGYSWLCAHPVDPPYGEDRDTAVLLGPVTGEKRPDPFEDPIKAGFYEMRVIVSVDVETDHLVAVPVGLLRLMQDLEESWGVYYYSINIVDVERGKRRPLNDFARWEFDIPWSWSSYEGGFPLVNWPDGSEAPHGEVPPRAGYPQTVVIPFVDWDVIRQWVIEGFDWIAITANGYQDVLCAPLKALLPEAGFEPYEFPSDRFPYPDDPCTEKGIWVEPGDSIQEAIDRVPEGGIVRLRPGHYAENLIINKSLTLVGAGREKTVIKSAQEGYPVVWVESDSKIEVVLAGLKITEAYGYCAVEEPEWICPYGLLVRGQAQVTLTNSQVSDNEGGLFVWDSAQVTLENSTVAENEWSLVVLHSAQVSLTNSTVSGNGSDGLKVGDSARVTIEGSLIEDNGTREECRDDWICNGILVWDNAHVELRHTTIRNNTDWGIAALLRECGYGYDDFEGTVLWEGRGNEIYGNGAGNVCLP